MSVNLFDASYYAAANPDLGAVGINTPEELNNHFRTSGLEDGRPFSPFVDINYYRASNPDLYRAGLTTNSEVYKHLEKDGLAEGRTFSPIVDLDFYLRQNPDLAAAFGGNRERAFEHLVSSGIAENRKFSPLVDLEFYLGANPDLAQAFGGDKRRSLQHLLLSGIREGRRYSPRDLGILNGGQSIGGDPAARPVVGFNNPKDFYKFSIDKFSDISVSLEGMNADADLQLIRDANNNGLPDDVEPIAPVKAPHSHRKGIDRFGLAQGTYFVKVSQSKADTPYQLKVFANPAESASEPDRAGNSLNTAYYIGDLGRPEVVRDAIGNNDPQDFYQFNLNTPSNARIRLEGLSADANLRVYQDRNGNGQADADEVVATELDQNLVEIPDLNGNGEIEMEEYFASLRSPEQVDPYPTAILAPNLAAGTYFISVSSVGGDTGYQLHTESIPVGVPEQGVGNIYPVSVGNIGIVNSRQVFNDFVGEANPYDFFAFDFDKTHNVKIRLEDLTTSADLVLLHDIDRDGAFASEEFIAYATDDSTSKEINRFLGPGSYYMGIAKRRGNTPYTIKMDFPDGDIPGDAAGNTLAAAFDFGVPSGVQIKSDFVGNDDPEDFYKFTINTFSNVNLFLYDQTANGQLQLIRDRNENGALDGDEIITTSEANGAFQDEIHRSLRPGTYFVRVGQTQGPDFYNLWLEANPAPPPPESAGNTLLEAFDLGVLNSTQTKKDMVGGQDLNDFYKFSVDQTRDVGIFLDGLSANADLRLIHDRNNNGQVEPDETIGLSAEGGATLEEINFKGLPAGTYYVWVAQSEGRTYYELNLTPTDFSRAYGHGMVDAAAAVAAVKGVSIPPDVADLGGNQWGLDLIKAPVAWQMGATGKGVVVAVVDGSLDYKHPDLDDNIWTNIDEITGNGIDDDGNGFVDDVRGWDFWDGDNDPRNLDPLEGHATHIAGTIAGENNGVGVTGVAPEATIMPVKVYGVFGGEEDPIIAGIRYAVDNGARVINLSLGGTVPSEAQREAIRYASSKGAVVVMASGNSGLSNFAGGKRFSPLNYPAQFATESGISVGAVESDRELAKFSNRAGTTPLDFVTAPGVDVYSSLQEETFEFYEGTSMAAPAVAGVAALLLSANPNLSPSQVEDIITGTANPNGIIETNYFGSFYS